MSRPSSSCSVSAVEPPSEVAPHLPIAQYHVRKIYISSRHVSKRCLTIMILIYKEKVSSLRIVQHCKNFHPVSRELWPVKSWLRVGRQAGV